MKQQREYYQIKDTDDHDMCTILTEAPVEEVRVMWYRIYYGEATPEYIEDQLVRMLKEKWPGTERIIINEIVYP